MADSMYRKEALEELSSPEQLDRLMQITGPKGWFALLGLGIVVISTVVWGILGSIPTNVTASGVYVKTGGVRPIISLGTGTITEINAEVGDHVSQGEVVAFLEQPELREEIRQIQSKLSQMNETREMIREFQTEALAGQMEYIKKQNQHLAERLEDLKNQLQKNRGILAARQELYEDGLISRQQLLAQQQQIDQIRDQIGQTRSDSAGLNVKKSNLENEMRQKLHNQDIKIAETRQKLNSLLNRLEKTSRIEAPHAGQVLELEVSSGALIQKGQRVLTMELVGRTIQDLELVAYVPPGQGKNIKWGMDVKISPETVRQEEYGFMLGKVKSVSPYPVSRQGMRQVIDNEQLIQQLSAQGAPIQVFVSLVPAAQTISGYRWSSPGGPPIEVTPGTLARVTITIDSQPPINLVIPRIRELLGV